MVGAVVLGMDIGGSLTRGLVVVGDHVVARAEVAGANVSEKRPEVVAARLESLFQQLGDPGPSIVVAGAAGADTDAGPG